jgi:hypothetical protein
MDFSEFLSGRARFSDWARYLIWTRLIVASAQAVIIAYLWSPI